MFKIVWVWLRFFVPLVKFLSASARPIPDFRFDLGVLLGQVGGVRFLPGRLSLLLLLLVGLAGALHGAFEWERLRFANDRAVQDFAGVIPDGQERSLEQQLRQFWTSHGIAVVVVTLADLDGGDIDDAGNRIYERLGIGRRGEDKGALLLVAVQDRKVRIEVGYGSEHILTDSISAGIIRADIAPAFRRGDYAGGISAATTRMTRLLAGDEEARPPSAEDGGGRSRWLPFLIFAGVFMLLGFFNRGDGGGRGRQRGRSGWGGPIILGGGGGRGWGGGGGGFGGGGFGGFGGGMSGGGGASGGW